MLSTITPPSLFRRLPTAGLTAVSALVLLAAACGGDDDDTGSAEPTNTATATATTPAEETATAPATATATAPAPSPTPPSTPPPANGGGDAEATAAGEAARTELARWLGPVGNLDAITIDAVEPVTWSNGCLDLGRVGQACTTALVDGYRVTLSLAQATYEIRTDKQANTILWAPGTTILVKFAEASTNSIVFETDDGNTLQTQPVSGSLFGVPANSLSEGEPVSIGIADAPQSGGHLLVWLDPAQA